MKRKAPVAADEPQNRRRQPQISCDFCRSKKLKCDRGAPCSSCVVRKLHCSSQPEPRPITDPDTVVEADSSILQRLQNLEKALFGSKRTAEAQKGFATASHASSPSYQDSERQQTAKFLDSTYTRDDHGVSLRPGRLRFRVAPAASLASPPSATGIFIDGDGAAKSAWMMTREEALLLLQDFIDSPYHLLPILHESSTRSLVEDFYTQLEQNQAGDPASAALILSIAATSASFFNDDSGESGPRVFASTEEAARASAAWSQSALKILQDPARPTSTSLAACQAWAIIAYVVYNAEGCSARFRFLHSCSVAVARDSSLHLVDSPTMIAAAAAAERQDDVATREIKRRLWWHLASTDWLLGLMGGPLDGTYTIQPRHTAVAYPRNLNDNDLSQPHSAHTTYPLNTPTQMSCFLQRIRLSEISRRVIDARAPGSPDLELLDAARVRALDREFAAALAEMPPFLRFDAPVPPGAPPHLALQCALVLLGLHVRRARLHRPFLLHGTEDPRCADSRAQCLGSARTVILISAELLDGSLALGVGRGRGQVRGGRGGPLTYRLGLVVGAMFMACTVLALNAGLSASRAGRVDSDTETHAELARACRALSAVGKKSAVAAGLVRSLRSVLRRYRVKALDEDEAIVVPQGSTNHNDVDIEAAATAPESTAEASARILAGGEGETHRVGEQQVDAPGDFEFDGLWEEFLGTMPMPAEEYDHLFAGLDSFCGPT
ncbi:hypothetical protein F5B20DRAFT_596821 [Whalleya microplaca]|nr:hypothetical protein F5B20DRAFT_596821 [Whalleya microplaca]